MATIRELRPTELRKEEAIDALAGYELGYSVSQTFWREFDNQDLFDAVVLGDGESDRTARHVVAFDQVLQSES